MRGWMATTARTSRMIRFFKSSNLIVYDMLHLMRQWRSTQVSHKPKRRTVKYHHMTLNGADKNLLAYDICKVQVDYIERVKRHRLPDTTQLIISLKTSASVDA